LEKQIQVTSQKKEKITLVVNVGKNKCTFDFFVKKSLEISSPQSDSMSSESDSAEER
jgi:hypothetical protein